jgi:hypothetical protein
MTGNVGMADANPPQGRHAVDARHLDIKQDDVRQSACYEQQGSARALRGGDFMALGHEKFCQKLEDHVIVIDRQHTSGMRHRPILMRPAIGSAYQKLAGLAIGETISGADGRPRERLHATSRIHVVIGRQRRRARIAFITAFAEDYDSGKAYEAGFDAYLRKPLNHTSFCELVARLPKAAAAQRRVIQ